MDQVTAEIVSYYQDRYAESARLDKRPQGRLERIRTLELLAGVLPVAPARILDVGGGPGGYARTLTSEGYAVRLVDIVPAHVAQARAGDPAIDAEVGDARELPEADHRWDATLLLGPLYHLHRRDERLRALREAIRVTRPGGPVVVAAIGRFAGPIDFASTARFDQRLVVEAERLKTTGANDPSIGFTQAYFHRVAELAAECRDAGLRDVTIHGVEGPAWAAAEAAAGGPNERVVFEAALELARVYSSEPDLLGMSAHLLAIGTA